MTNKIPSKLNKLARENVIVKTGIDLYLAGRITWEETLIEIAINLGNRNKELSQKCLELGSKTPPAPIIIQGDSSFALSPQTRSVWIMTNRNYSGDTDIVEVYSTKELAESDRNNQSEHWEGYGLDITEWVVLTS